MSEFEKWLDTTKLRGYIDENSLEAAYEAGAQSKLAEIDELNTTLYEIEMVLNDSCYSTENMVDIIKDMLKGTTNEQ